MRTWTETRPRGMQRSRKKEIEACGRSPRQKKRQMRDRNNHRPDGRIERRTKHASYPVGNLPTEIVRSNASIHPATDLFNPSQETKREGTEDKDAWKATPCNAPTPQGKKNKSTELHFYPGTPVFYCAPSGVPCDSITHPSGTAPNPHQILVPGDV